MTDAHWWRWLPPQTRGCYGRGCDAFVLDVDGRASSQQSPDEPPELRTVLRQGFRDRKPGPNENAGTRPDDGSRAAYRTNIAERIRKSLPNSQAEEALHQARWVEVSHFLESEELTWTITVMRPPKTVATPINGYLWYAATFP